MVKARFITTIVFTLLIYSQAAADTTRINFEVTDHPLALVGAEANGLYEDQGITFPSSPRIARIGLWSSQVLQQGEPGYGGPDPLPSFAGRCEPLEIGIASELRARRVELTVLTRHVRYYSVEASAGDVIVDRMDFWPPGHFRGLALERTIVLEALEGEPDIRRVVASPGDCFDLMTIDDLVIKGDGPSRDPDRVYVTAYELNQAVMSRLTTRPRPDLASIPDTRLAALPESRLPFVRGRSTVARFFLGALRRPVVSYEPRLEVTIINDDGSSRTVELTENTVPFTGPPPGALNVGVVDPLLPDDALTRLLVEQRNSIDRTADFVISGAALENARLIDLKLLDPGRRRLAWVRATLEGPFTMAFNLVRVQGIGAAAGIRGPVPTEPTRTNFQRYFNAVFPISDRPTLTDTGVFIWDGAGSDCGSLLDLTLVFTSPPLLPPANYQGIIFLVSAPRGCDGVAPYNTPGAITIIDRDTAAMEVSHNIGINHAGNMHDEDAFGAGDWEAWPYHHGSIGTPNQADRSQRFGVYGAIMNQGGDRRGPPFGSWQLSIVLPCGTGDPARLFPTCTAIDDSITHDYMSYGPRSILPVHGRVRWISDINYHRVYRFLQDCIRLDPPNRFLTEGTDVAPGIGCTPGSTDSASAGLSAAKQGKMPSVEALIVGGKIVNDVSTSLSVLRRPVAADVLSRSSGKYELILFGRDQKELRRIQFDPIRVSEQKKDEELFRIVMPFEPELGNFVIRKQGKVIIKREATASPILSSGPMPAKEGWVIGQKATVTWEANDHDSRDLRALLLYSPDGHNWYPLALVDGQLGKLVIDTSALPPSKEARLYLSLSDGMNTVMKQSNTFIARAPGAGN